MISATPIFLKEKKNRKFSIPVAFNRADFFPLFPLLILHLDKRNAETDIINFLHI